MCSVLTRDNPQLSRPKNSDLGPSEINFTPVSEAVREYVRESISDSTRKAYASDLKHFAEWGGNIPATDIMVADYLAACAGELSVATIARRVAAIAKAHTARGARNPTQRARSLGSMVRERAAEVESDRGISNEVIAAIREREIFCILQPRMFGGFEHDWEVMTAVSFEIAAACSPTVWVTSLGIGHQWFVSKFPIEAQHDIWDDDPDAITFGSYAPSSNTKAFTKPSFATESKDQGLAVVLSGVHLPGQTNSSGFTIPNDESDCGCIRQNPVPCSRS